MPTNAKTCPEVTLFTTGTIVSAVYSYCVASPSNSRLAALHTSYFVILKAALAIGLLSSQRLPNSQKELTTKTISLPIPEDKKKCCVSFSVVCWSGFVFSTVHPSRPCHPLFAKGPLNFLELKRTLRPLF